MIGLEHQAVTEDHEHGRRWHTCLDCGAIWDDADDQVTEGDGFCEERAMVEEVGI